MHDEQIENPQLDRTAEDGAFEPDTEALLRAMAEAGESNPSQDSLVEGLAGLLSAYTPDAESAMAAMLALSAQTAAEDEEDDAPFCDIPAETVVDPADSAHEPAQTQWLETAPTWLAPQLNVAPAEEAEATIENLMETIDQELGEAATAFSGSTSSETDAGQQIIFMLSGTSYAVSIREVLEMSTVPRTTPLPNVPDFVRGVTNLRGEILAVLDLRTVLGLTPPANSVRERMIVVRPPGSDAAAGLIVDSVRGLAKIADGQLRQPSGPLEDPVVPYLAGVTEHEDQVLHSLDLKKLFRAPEIAALSAH